MPAFYRSFSLLLLSAILALCSCDSSLDVDAKNRKEIPLDPADTSARIFPDSIEFELYLKNGWDDSRIRLYPDTGSVHISLDTIGPIPILWANIEYSLHDTITSKNSTTRILLRNVRLRADSVAVDRMYQMSGSPDNGNGTSVGIVRYDGSFPLDTLTIVPPSQPEQVQSYATLSLAPTDSGVSGVKKITGVYTFSAILYDVASQQIISLPLEGLISIYCH